MTDARILIVEDEEALRLDLVELLQGEGYDVLDRGDGGEAIAAIELYRPRLVVCDVQLPSLGGIGILKAVRSSRIASPIMIMMTAYGDHETIETLRSLGATECLIKPVSFDELLAAIERNLSGVETGVTVQAAADVSPAPAVPAASSAVDAPVILVVEDETELAAEMAELFDSFGHAAACAGTVEAALAKLRAYPSLKGALVDLGLGTESGLDLIRRVARDPELAARHIKFLVLSGRTPDAEEISALPIVPSGCLSKPARIADIVSFANGL
jgi:DNA-binding response OmpR family regulator